MVSPCRGHGSLLHRPRRSLWTEPHCRSTDGPSRSARDCRKPWKRAVVAAVIQLAVAAMVTAVAETAVLTTGSLESRFQLRF